MPNNDFPPPPALSYPSQQQKMEVEITRISPHVIEALKDTVPSSCAKCQRALTLLDGYTLGADLLDPDFPGELLEKLREILS